MIYSMISTPSVSPPPSLSPPPAPSALLPFWFVSSLWLFHFNHFRAPAVSQQLTGDSFSYSIGFIRLLFGWQLLLLLLFQEHLCSPVCAVFNRVNWIGVKFWGLSLSHAQLSLIRSLESELNEPNMKLELCRRYHRLNLNLVINWTVVFCACVFFFPPPIRIDGDLIEVWFELVGSNTWMRLGT